MTEIRLAGNALAINNDYGHLQLVHVSDGVQQEIEVQRGAVWRYELRSHDGATNDEPHTPYFNGHDHPRSDDLYRWSALPFAGRDTEAVWGLLTSIHEQFSTGRQINYELTTQNSNSYIGTLLWMVGIDIAFVIEGATPTLVRGGLILDPFPAWDLNVLLSSDTALPFHLKGTTAPDFIRTGVEADRIAGAAGDDTLDGGTGDDTLDGGDGDDLVGAGDGADELSGGEGFDTLTGGEGADSLDGGDGDDLLDAGVGRDKLTGGEGDDTLIGGDDRDTLNAGAGEDELFGGEGQDVLEGGAGNDDLAGEAGDDVYRYRLGDGSDVIFDSSGDDRLVIDLLGAGRSTSDVGRTWSGDDLVLSISNGGSAPAATITIRAAAGSGAIERIEVVGVQDPDYEDPDFKNPTQGDDRIVLGGDGPSDLDGRWVRMDMETRSFRDADFDDDFWWVSKGALRSEWDRFGAWHDRYEWWEYVFTNGSGEQWFQNVFTRNSVNWWRQSENLKLFAYDGGLNAAEVSLLGGETFLWEQNFGRGAGAGDDTVYGGSVDGWLGDDQLFALRPGRLTGGEGDDRLEGHGGSILDGGPGDDVIVSVLPGGETANPDGDVAVFEGAAIRVDLTRAGRQRTGEGDDLLSGIRNVRSGDGNDRLKGDAFGNVLEGGGGSDTLDGGAGDDILHGGPSVDRLSGGPGDDVYFVGVTYVSAGHGITPDVVVERNDGGHDRIVTNAYSFTLPEHVEALAFDEDLENREVFEQDATPGTYTGNALDNSIDANDAANTIRGGDGNDRLSGRGGDDSLAGGRHADTLWGGSGRDTLDGGQGADLLEGGDGDDVYLVDSLRDVVREHGGGGFDRVVASVRGYVLPENVERLEVAPGADVPAGTRPGDLRGYALTGNRGDNVLVGGARGDTLAGGAGNDSLEGGAGDDELDGGAGRDSLYGGDGNDRLIFSAGGWASLDGGLGDDLFIYESPTGGSVSLEDAGGRDTIDIRVGFDVTFRVSGAFERVLGGSGRDVIEAVDGTTTPVRYEGRGGTDTLVGGGGDDRLDGGEGNDLLVGRGGDDVYVVGPTDRVYEAPGEGDLDWLVVGFDFALRPGENVEGLRAAPGAAGLRLTGDEGANRLYGGAGIDTLTGGAGDDVYLVDRAEDVVVEAPGGGDDKILASASVTLPDDVERLTLSGPGPIDGTGNALANRIVGADGANRLAGGGGADVLFGLGGRDVFVLDAPPVEGQPDSFRDFAPGEDAIELSAAAFPALTFAPDGVHLAAAAFSSGGAAAPLRYDSRSGALSYDADGEGGAAPVTIAVLPRGLALTVGDLLLA